MVLDFDKESLELSDNKFRDLKNLLTAWGYYTNDLKHIEITINKDSEIIINLGYYLQEIK